MKRYLLVVALAATVLSPASAQETTISIPILNPTFDADGMSCAAGANCYENAATGWLCGPSSGVAKFSTVQYPAAPPDGIYLAAIGDSYVTGSILQTLGASVQANTTYILTLAVGARADYPFTGYVAALLAGNVTVASRNAATPVSGTFVADVIVYESGANPAQLGQPLQILVKSLGTGQVNVGVVSLTATPETENNQ
jgi:hypothetical protein